MLQVTEIPHLKPEKSYSFASKEELLEAWKKAYERHNDTPFECVTGKQLVECYEEELTVFYPETAKLIQQHGEDTLFYKTWDMEEYQLESIDEFDTWVDFVKSDLQYLKIESL